jgi:hypothetical protein
MSKVLDIMFYWWTWPFFFVPSGNGHVFESVEFFFINYYCRLSEKPDIYILVNKIHGWQRYYNLHKCGQTKMKDFH